MDLVPGDPVPQLTKAMNSPLCLDPACTGLSQGAPLGLVLVLYVPTEVPLDDQGRLGHANVQLEPLHHLLQLIHIHRHHLFVRLYRLQILLEIADAVVLEPREVPAGLLAPFDVLEQAAAPRDGLPVEADALQIFEGKHARHFFFQGLPGSCIHR